MSDRPSEPGSSRARTLAAEVERQVGTTVPGLGIVVVNADRTLLCEARGLADIATEAEFERGTVCNWFSMTKLVTATVAVQLADEGRLDLDAPIGRYYEPFSIVGPSERARTVTARHLLSHSSGLANPMPMRWVHPATTPGPDRSRLVRRVLRRHRRLRFEPGTSARYSNLGYLVLGEIIEAVAGRSYESCVVGQVLEPLGLTATGFVADPARRWATPYQRRRTGLNLLLPLLVPSEILGARVDGFRALQHFYVDGAAYGGLVGPVTEAARFVQAHLGDGTIDGVELLSPSSARAMRTLTAGGPKFRTGLGWYRRGRAPDAGFVEHLGGGAGFWNCARLYPEHGIGVVVMGNASSYDHEALITAAVAGAGRL